MIRTITLRLTDDTDHITVARDVVFDKPLRLNQVLARLSEESVRLIADYMTSGIRSDSNDHVDDTLA